MSPAESKRTTFRYQLRPSDCDAVRRLVVGTGFFSPEEVEIAVELVDESMTKGEVKSGYRFVMADCSDQLYGYSCFGPIAGTESSYDLYWIVVDPNRQRVGIGRSLMAATEAQIRKLRGTRVYVDTSNRSQYHPTRKFYEECGYRLVAQLPNFYTIGDDKAIFEKELL